MTLADKIVVLNGGVVQQVGSPIELYQRPANLFVAGFIGSPKMNLLSGQIEALGDQRISVSGKGYFADRHSGRHYLAIR